MDPGYKQEVRIHDSLFFFSLFHTGCPLRLTVVFLFFSLLEILTSNYLEAALEVFVFRKMQWFSFMLYSWKILYFDKLAF